MDSNDRLRVVVDGEGTAEREQPPPERPGRQPARLRPNKALPTDRAKFDTQTAALRAYVSASNRGEEAVGAPDIAAFLSITEATAALVNSFFVDAGFLVKEAKGRYKPVAEVNEYQRLWSLDPDAARSHLAGPLKTSWYYVEARKALEAGQVAEDVVINVLARAAGVGGDRRPQLELIVDWLGHAGLIERDGGMVRLTDAEAPLVETPTEVDEGEGESPDTPSEGTTKDQGANAPTSPQVVGFDFRFSLTADDLSKLTPEQIAALFEAVGKVIAIKAAMRGGE
jgi:hypothetical protein